MTQEIITLVPRKHLARTYGCHRTGVAGSHQADRSSRPSLLSDDRSLVAIAASDSWLLVTRKPEAEA